MTKVIEIDCCLDCPYLLVEKGKIFCDYDYGVSIGIDINKEILPTCPLPDKEVNNV